MKLSCVSVCSGTMVPSGHSHTEAPGLEVEQTKAERPSPCVRPPAPTLVIGMVLLAVTTLSNPILNPAVKVVRA